MSELNNLLRRHAVWSHHLQKVCDEIGACELAYKPMPESNSAAWILVHLIDNYREFVELAGPERSEEILGDLPRPTESSLARMGLRQALELLSDYREAFLALVEQLRSSERLEQTCPAGEGKSWLDLVYAVASHEVYHCGQLAYLSHVMQQKAKAARE